MSHPKRRDPFAELYGDLSDRFEGDRWHPDVDVFETSGSVIVRVELAGVRSEDLKVNVDGQELRISGVRYAPEAAGATRLHQMEIVSGPFERRLAVPVPFDRDRVSARLSEGLLTVTLAKRPARRSVEIERG